MKVNRCLTNVCEEANEEFFIRVPTTNFGISESARSASCWIPDGAKKGLRAFTLMAGVRNVRRVLVRNVVDATKLPELHSDVFVILAMAPDRDLVFKAIDLIVFAGGDVLALLEPIEYTGLNLADPHQIMPH